MISAVAIVLVLGALIFFHELGHFLVAKSLGVGVRTFSLGFGKKLAGFVLNRTEYRLSLVPLGGYVQMVGESPGDELPGEFQPEESFSEKPAWQRMLVVSAGPLFNFILAWLIYLGIFLVIGQQLLAPTIGKVLEDTPAKRAGLQAGDRVVSVQGERIEHWSQMARHIRDSAGEELRMQVDREGQLLAFRVTPKVQSAENLFGEEVKTPRIGVKASGDKIYRDVGPLEATIFAAKQTWNVIRLTVLGVVKLIERVVPLETLGGPILIAQLVGEQAQQGLVDVLGLTALISVNLGILNLLPVPVLDGGHIVFFGLEALRGKPVDPKWRELAMRVGLSLLLALMILVIYNDLTRLLG